MIINFGGKVSDMCWLNFQDGEEEYSHEGYVPSIGAIGGGDYIEIEIDNETGKILNWKPLSVEEIKEACEDA